MIPTTSNPTGSGPGRALLTVEAAANQLSIGRTTMDVIRAVRDLERRRDAGRVTKSGHVWTVEKWLTYWVEKIAAPAVRRTTMVGYRSSVYNHLIPGVGAHRLDKLRPEHLETLYAILQQPRDKKGKGLSAGAAHLAHRTLRAALNEAVRRRHIAENPAKIAQPPRVEEEEIVPFTVDEARRILDTAKHTRSDTRFVVALTLGLRRGEALGLKWPDNTPCGRRYGAHCPERHSGGGGDH